MVLLLSPSALTKLIILLVFITIPSVNCRAGHGHGHGRAGHGSRLSRIFKNKAHSNNIHRQSPVLHRSNRPISVQRAAGGGAAIIVGAFALRSYVSNYNKVSTESRPVLTNGTGSICVNRENFSNFVFNEFHCPLSPIFTTNARYCCGAFQQQYCCSFWESGTRAIGTIVSIVTICSLFLLLIICGIIYYRRHLKRKESPRMKSYIRHVDH